MKNKKGISLVALVITIIALIIITTTVVLNIGGENSIIGKAREAVEKDRVSQLQEQVVIWKMEVKTAEQIGGTSRTLEHFLTELENKKMLKAGEVTSIQENNAITIAGQTISFDTQE